MPLHRPSDDGPASFHDMLSTAGYRAVATALELGLFAALTEGPLDADDLAARLGTDPRGTGLLADVLVTLGHLEPGYANSPSTTRWLTGPYAEVDRFWSTVLFSSWTDLTESVRTGRPALDFYRWLVENPETLHRFQAMLSTHADAIAPEVTTLITPGVTLLDVGGGHAKYAIRFCAGNPDLTATVVDLPDAVEVGRAAVAAAGLTDRIGFAAGDYDEVDLGGGYDTVLLFNVVHGRAPDANVTLLARVAKALRPGGRVVLLEHDHHVPDAGSDAFARVFSLNLFHGQGGQVYPASEITSWLTKAGFTEPTVHPLSTSPGQSLLVATT
ncbi:methyltransferase [Saccharothrix violaceirubra]|uniref:SAM-dependent methyltransferase n=1 Tax=Saccharothrix violaceirubra TaxID=413306 RepID=A0A7W7T1W4_9PSEU|nr:methyltransferase [Saccharothrix violaceirubra]MBB4965062.1 SAM-dependent methyltransferase [Saccharothrix violaceirubra]